MSIRRINALTQQLAGAQLAPAPAAAEGKIPTVHCALLPPRLCLCFLGLIRR